MRIVAAVLVLIAQIVSADGLPLQDGRFMGEVMEFKLTQHQKRVIERYRTCQLERSKEMNIYTPYVFTLTPEQMIEIRHRVGFAPATFQVFETVRGFNDAGPFWNLALRYSADRIEIPISLLISDREAKEAAAEQGWKLNNPCFPLQPKK